MKFTWNKENSEEKGEERSGGGARGGPLLKADRAMGRSAILVQRSCDCFVRPGGVKAGRATW